MPTDSTTRFDRAYGDTRGTSVYARRPGESLADAKANALKPVGQSTTATNSSKWRRSRSKTGSNKSNAMELYEGWMEPGGEKTAPPSAKTDVDPYSLGQDVEVKSERKTPVPKKKGSGKFRFDDAYLKEVELDPEPDPPPDPKPKTPPYEPPAPRPPSSDETDSEKERDEYTKWVLSGKKDYGRSREMLFDNKQKMRRKKKR